MKQWRKPFTEISRLVPQKTQRCYPFYLVHLLVYFAYINFELRLWYGKSFSGTLAPVF